MKENDFTLNSINPMIGVGTRIEEPANKVRLDIKNIEEYLKKGYMANADDFRTYEVNRLNMRVLVQRDYGEENDCSLVSITTIIDYYTNHKYEIEEIYDKVVDIAKRYGYNGETYGTISLTIKKILQRAYAEFKINKPAKEKLFKNLGYSYDFIKKRIDMGAPMILSMWDDGRNYYRNHSVTIIGYRTFLLSKGNDILKLPTLMVYDNWYKSTGYIDFTQLGVISSINY